jgi:hypothetical protein
MSDRKNKRSITSNKGRKISRQRIYLKKRINYFQSYFQRSTVIVYLAMCNLHRNNVLLIALVCSLGVNPTSAAYTNGSSVVQLQISWFIADFSAPEQFGGNASTSILSIQYSTAACVRFIDRCSRWQTNYPVCSSSIRPLCLAVICIAAFEHQVHSCPLALCPTHALKHESMSL